MASLGQHLRWCHRLDCGMGLLDFASFVFLKQPAGVTCSLINLSMRVFKQAAVHYSLSIPGFVNKKNKCDLTQKCPAGNNCFARHGRGWPDVSLMFVLGIHSMGSWEFLQAVSTPTLLLVSVWKGRWSRRDDWMRVGNGILGSQQKW